MNKLLNRSFFFTLTVIVGSAGRSSAQNSSGDVPSPISLTEVWQKVTANSKVVTIRELELLQSKEAVQHAAAGRLPDISLDGEYAKLSNLPQYTNGILQQATLYPIAHTTYNLGASVYFNLYNGGHTSRNIESLRIGSKIKEQQRNLSASEMKLLAAAYYLDILRSRAFEGLLMQDISEQNKVLVQIKTIYKNGVVLKSDVLRAELKLSKQQLEVEQIRNDISIASQKISLLTGQDEATQIEPLEPFLPDTLQLAVYETLVRKGLSTAPETNISTAEQKLTELQLKDVKAKTLPHIGLFANYAYSYPQGRFYPYVLSLYGLGMVGVKASVPLSSFFKNRHEVNSAALAVKKAGIEHLNTEDNIKNQLKEAYLRLQEDLHRIKVAKTNMIQAAENLRIVKNSYLNQTSLITDYLDADVQLLQSKFDLSAARIAAQLHYYQLQKIIGAF